MLKERNRAIRRIQLGVDLLTTTASFFIAYYFRSYDFAYLPNINSISYYLFILYIILPLWAVLLTHYKAYASIRTQGVFDVLLPALKTVAAGGVFLIFILFIFKIQTISRALIILFLLVNTVLLGAERLSMYAFLRYIRRKGRNYRTVLIVGTSSRAAGLAELILKNKEWGLRIVGFIDKELSQIGREMKGGKVLGGMNDIHDILTTQQVDEVIFVVPRKWLDEIEEAVMLCEEMGRKASIAADFYPHKIARMGIEEFSHWPLLSFNPTSRLDEAETIKRLADILISGAFLIFGAPLLILIALAVKFSSRGPVFFKQKRSGMNGRIFNMLKFRTMVDNAEAMKGDIEHLNEMSGPVFKIKNDPRITPLGHWLRKYSLDELPQFINVFKGDMSVVGPRPPIPSEIENYDIWQRRRLSVRPGITCLWQIGGRNRLDFEDWVKLDLEYIDNWSWALDFKIIMKTIPALFMGTGV